MTPSLLISGSISPTSKQIRINKKNNKECSGIYKNTTAFSVSPFSDLGNENTENDFFFVSRSGLYFENVATENIFKTPNKHIFNAIFCFY